MTSPRFKLKSQRQKVTRLRTEPPGRPAVLHINQSDLNHTQKHTRVPIRYVVTKRYEGQRITSWERPATQTNKDLYSHAVRSGDSVSSPILRLYYSGQLSREGNMCFPLFLFAPENLVSHDGVRQPRPALACSLSTPRLNVVLTHRRLSFPLSATASTILLSELEIIILVISYVCKYTAHALVWLTVRR